MSTVSLKNASLSGAVKSNSLLAGNVAFDPIPPSAYDLLETTVLDSDASSVSFTGLGSYSDYKHLQIRGVARSDRNAAGEAFNIQFNSDSATSYTRHYLQGTGSNVASSASTSGNFMSNILALISNDGATGNYSGFVVDVLDFASTTKNTTVRALSGQADSAEHRIRLGSGLYDNTAAITSISFFPDNFDLVTGSRFSLYGIKAA